MSTASGMEAGRGDGHKKGRELLPAVSSRDDPLVIDERAATEVVADVDGHLPGLGVGCTLVATHDPVIRRGRRCDRTKTTCSSHCLDWVPSLGAVRGVQPMDATCGSQDCEEHQANHLDFNLPPTRLDKKVPPLAAFIS